MSTIRVRLRAGVVAYPWSFLLAAVLLAGGIGLFGINSLLACVGLAAAAAFALAILPIRPLARNVAISIGTILACLAVAEMALYAAKGSHTGDASAVVRHDPAPMFLPAPLVGWLPQASTTVRALSRQGDRTIYDALYTIDADRRRVVPASNPDGEVVIFLGDSFVFGDGVNDDETLPQQVALATGGRFRIVNFGVSGHSASQALTRLENGAVDAAIAGGKVRQVFLWFDDDHLLRDGGDYAHFGHWRLMAQYELTPGGLRIAGPAGAVRDGRSWIVRRTMSAVLRSEIAFIARRVLRVSRQLALAEALLSQIRRTVRERYGCDLVVLYWSNDRLFYHDRVAAMIARTGSTMLAIQPLFAQAGLAFEDFLIPGDGHGGGRFHRFVGEELALRFLRR
ncbi:MAG: SGNH/GDSL hydrolase family protein [Alphaproteobacteria bacterium]|nr:SGNH/GDSL hydrolase family protein [Alphaproteobacteria bacterium]MCW5744315.1 SGNH/GDSL hydrolase family protein [Alphaproteobacteria bacterium]